MLLDWGPVPGSYGWVFPKGDTLTVGVIGDRAQGEPLRAYYRSFVASLGLDLADAAHDGGHLTRVRRAGIAAGARPGPGGRRRRRACSSPGRARASRFALRSGALAGAAAARDPAAYPARSSARLGAEMAAGRRALAAFAAHPRVVHEVMRSLPGMWGLFVRLVCGRTRWTEQLRAAQVRGAGLASSAAEGRLRR